MRRLLFTLAVLLITPSAYAQVYHEARTLTADETTVDMDTSRMGTATIEVAGTFDGTITFEVSLSRNTWVGVDCATPDAPETAVNTTTSTGTWLCPVAGLRGLRARMSTYASGTATVYMGAAATGSGSAGGTSSTDTAHLAAIEVATEALQADVLSGYTLETYISAAATEDENEIDANAGVLMGISAYNNHASANAFIKCTNATAANTTPGTTAVIYQIMVPFGGGFVDRNINATYTTALTCFIVLGEAATDTAEVAANDVGYNITTR